MEVLFKTGNKSEKLNHHSIDEDRGQRTEDNKKFYKFV